VAIRLDKAAARCIVICRSRFSATINEAGLLGQQSPKNLKFPMRGFYLPFSDIGCSFPSLPSLHNLSLALGFLARIRIADPCVSRKPFMRRIAVWTVGLPEKYRARAENRGLNVCAGGNCSSGFRATNHKNAHQAVSWLCVGGPLPLVCDEKIKAQRQFIGFLAARRSQASEPASQLKSGAAF